MQGMAELAEWPRDCPIPNLQLSGCLGKFILKPIETNPCGLGSLSNLGSACSCLKLPAAFAIQSGYDNLVTIQRNDGAGQ